MSAIAKPFGVLLMFLYDLVNNYGVALILFAILVRVILLPFQMKGKLGMMRQTRLQPKLAELQKKHGDNKNKINEEMAKLYKEEGVNPMSGCLWSFLPLPIMIALFLAIREPLTMMMNVPAALLAKDGSGALTNLINATGFQNTLTDYYVQIAQTQWISEHFTLFTRLSESLGINLKYIDFSFLGINLDAQPQWKFFWTTDWSDVHVWGQGLVLFILPLLSAGSQYLATAINKKLNPTPAPEGQAGAGSMNTMMMLMPLMSVYFGFIVPAALSIYWMVGTLLQILQDVVLTKHYQKKLDAEDAIKNEERRKKEAEIEAKRLEAERKKAEGIAERVQNPNTSKRRKQNSEKQGQLERAAEWEKKNAPDEESANEPSRVGNRRYARGRAYDPDRYTRGVDAEGEDTAALPEKSRLVGSGSADTDDKNEDFDSEDFDNEDFENDEDFEDDEGLEDDGCGDESYDEEDDDADDDAADENEDDAAADDADDPNDARGNGPAGNVDEAPPTTRFGTKRFDSKEEEGRKAD